MHSSRSGILAALTLSLAFSSQAMAQKFLRTGPNVFNYNFVELKYLDVGSADGFGLVGSADIKPNVALKVAYASLNIGSFDSNILRLGASNYIGSVTYDQADWVYEAGLDFAGGDGSDDIGLFISVGARYAVNDALEVNGALELSTLFDTDLSARIAALYEVSTGFAALVETEIGDDTAIGLGLRFYWR